MRSAEDEVFADSNVSKTLTHKRDEDSARRQYGGADFAEVSASQVSSTLSNSRPLMQTQPRRDTAKSIRDQTKFI